MSELGRYIYCIIPCQEERSFDIAGMGNNGSLVHTVSRKGLAAVVSDTLVKQYESTRSNMMAHERVLEKIISETDLLPVRFGTVADSNYSAEDIKRLLSIRADEFHSLLEEIKGKVELGVKAFWRDEKVIFEEIVAENPDIRKLRDSSIGKSPETIHFELIRLGEMIEDALKSKRAKEASQILSPLRQLACSTRENQVLATRIIVNAAFMVDKAREAKFDQAVNKLDKQLGKRMAIKYVGPVPPYNFVNIVVNWQELK